jgi:fructose-bisphosphate aldolase class II/tagatose 1,6-diphosphate aldolase GatY/KbaY
MPLSLPIARLVAAQEERRAIAAFSVYNLEQTIAVCRAAEATGSEILIQAGSSAFAYAGQGPLAALAVTSARSAQAGIGVHLDHSRDPSEISECIALGYTSVMFDGSALEIAENERLTAAVVREAHERGAWVEAELAGIGGNEDSSEADSVSGSMTDPGVAARFVERTAVDALAVAIGNVHGIPARPVRLDLDRLAAIRDRVAVPLVLHGASGLPDDDVLGAIQLGVAKININTELRRAFAAGLSEAVAGRDDFESILGPARRAMEAVAAEKIRLYAGAASAV